MKKLYKSYTDKKICGVCGGIAQALGVDSTIVRVIWIACTVCLGLNILAYILCALVLPESDIEIVETPEKRLYKSYKDRKLFGVCGGLAEYFDIDSGFVRIGFIVLMFLGGSGILLYILLAWIIPNKAINKYNNYEN